MCLFFHAPNNFFQESFFFQKNHFENINLSIDNAMLSFQKFDILFLNSWKKAKKLCCLFQSSISFEGQILS